PGTLYRFEKRAIAHAWNGRESKTAAEAYFVGLLAVRKVDEEDHIEEFMTGGLLSDLGDELPPRPAGDPIRRAYVLNSGGDVSTPASRRGGLVVWTLPFEFFLMPRESAAETLSQRAGVRPFASHAAKPALVGTWTWRSVSQSAPRS